MLQSSFPTAAHHQQQQQQLHQQRQQSQQHIGSGAQLPQQTVSMATADQQAIDMLSLNSDIKTAMKTHAHSEDDLKTDIKRRYKGDDSSGDNNSKHDDDDIEDDDEAELDDVEHCSSTSAAVSGSISGEHVMNGVTSPARGRREISDVVDRTEALIGNKRRASGDDITDSTRRQPHQSKFKYRRVDDDDEEEGENLSSDCNRQEFEISTSGNDENLGPANGRSDRFGGVLDLMINRSPRRVRRNSDVDGEDDRDGSSSPFAEIKNQRPLGLLAQHRITATPTSRQPSSTDAVPDKCSSPLTMDLSSGARSRNREDDDIGSGCSASDSKRLGTNGSSGEEINRLRHTEDLVRRQTSANSDTFDDEEGADMDADGEDDDEDQTGYYHRGLRHDAHRHATPLPSPGMNFYGGHPSMTSLPPTPTSANLMVGLDYSMHRQHHHHQQQQLHHQLQQLHQARFESLMDRRFMPSPPPPSTFQLPQSPSSGDASSLDRDEACSPSSACGSGVGMTGSPSPEGHQRQWTFQEQFKQLYDMSEDQKRKDFLDELFTFMQKRGTPVNRIPIMAKQTLDLYELFRLVVSKGGLVEVINKKLWREITKGLNLPSSITSAAFTLRTQYMKYLYPFECEKLKLSTLAELQYAVDGNRREGRRPSYCGAGGPGGVNGTPGSGLPGNYSPLSHHHHNAAAMTPGLPPCTPPCSVSGLPSHLAVGTGSMQSTAMAAAAAAMFQQQQQQHPGLNIGGVPTSSQQFSVDGFNAAAMAAAAAAMAARVNCLGQLIQSGRGQDAAAVFSDRNSVDQRQIAAAVAAATAGNQLRSVQSQLQMQQQLPIGDCSGGDAQRSAMEAIACSRAMQEVQRALTSSTMATVSSCALSGAKISPPIAQAVIMKVEDRSSPASKRLSSPVAATAASERGTNTTAAVSDGGNFAPPSAPFPGHVVVGGRGGVGSAHIKLASRNDGRSEFDSSIMASMEINGITYQGVLFAQTPQHHLLARV